MISRFDSQRMVINLHVNPNLDQRSHDRDYSSALVEEDHTHTHTEKGGRRHSWEMNRVHKVVMMRQSCAQAASTTVRVQKLQQQLQFLHRSHLQRTHFHSSTEQSNVGVFGTGGFGGRSSVIGLDREEKMGGRLSSTEGTRRAITRENTPASTIERPSMIEKDNWQAQLRHTEQLQKQGFCGYR